MTITELETLLKRAEDVLGKKIKAVKGYNNKWALYPEDEYLGRNLQEATIDQCITQLKQWALPPKPNTLTLNLPTGYCEAVIEHFDKSSWYQVNRNCELHNAIVEALAPYQTEGV